MSTGPWEGGKGSRPRKYNVNKYLDNYERIFGNGKKQATMDAVGKDSKDRECRDKATQDRSGRLDAGDAKA